MRRWLGLILAIVLVAGCTQRFDPLVGSANGPLIARLSTQSFPSGFLWGVATAGLQNEGNDTTSNWVAWTAKGKGEPVGAAADFWNRYEEDLDRAADMGLNAFRLSIEWSRIEPERGRTDRAAVRHYHRILDAAIARGLTPVVTAFHFAYPAWLDRPLGGGAAGWENDETLVEFRRYVDWLAREYGPKVRYWITINEPNTFALCAYLAGVHPPGKTNPLAYRDVLDRLVLAHRSAYDAIHGQDPDAMVSVNPFAFHQRSAMTDSVGGNPDEIPFLDACRSKLDYLAYDYYYSLTLKDIPKVPQFWNWPIDPQGFYEVTMRLWKRYRLPLLVAENGIATYYDQPRSDGWTREAFLVNHVAELKRAHADGAKVLGYIHWTLTDNYEWGSYAPRFGFYAIDRRDPALGRIKTPAVDVYRQITRSNGLSKTLLERYLGQRN